MRSYVLVAIIATTGLSACQPNGEGELGGDAARLEFFPETLAAPIEVLTQTEAEVLAVVTAGEPVLSPTTLDGHEYTKLRLPGFSAKAKDGAPEVPSVSVLVTVPRGMRLAFDILERDVDAARVLASPLAFLARRPVHNGKVEFATQDLAAYAAITGGAPVVIEDESWAANEKLATIRFYPVKYDPARRTIEVTRHLKVRFYFKSMGLGLAGDEPPVGGAGTGVFRGISLNREVGAPPKTYAATKLDLIIAAESLKEPLQRYLQFKRSRGRQVKELYVSGKDTAAVKEMIRAEYKGATPPTSTMLVGSIAMIPGFPGDADNAYTDYPYSTLDGGDKPDVSLGRVPAHDAGELNAWIEKAMARETDTTRKIDQVLLTAGEDVNLGCPTNVGVVGDKIKPAGPRVEIVQKFRSEGASTSDVISGYNAAPNLIVYDGHGYQEGMTEIPLLIGDLGKLTNKQYPIILDIACLNANWQGGADARNFAEMILLRPGAGAAGIMASGGSGYGHDYFQTIGTIMAQGRKAMGTGDTRTNEIGQVILLAKAQHGDQDRSFWNYYGDPASSVWEPSDTGSGTGGEGTIPPPTNPPTNPPSGAAVEIFAALGSGDAEAPLFAALNGAAKGVSYCFGDKATCQGAANAWLGMTKAPATGAAAGVEIWVSKKAAAMSDGAKITVFAKMADDAEVFREVVVKPK